MHDQNKPKRNKKATSTYPSSLFLPLVTGIALGDLEQGIVVQSFNVFEKIGWNSKWPQLPMETRFTLSHGFGTVMSCHRFTFTDACKRPIVGDIHVEHQKFSRMSSLRTSPKIKKLMF